MIGHQALRWGTVSVLLLVAATAAHAASPAIPPYSVDEAYRHLEMLAGQIGERPAGTPAEARAVDYIAAQFKSWGLDTTLEPVRVPVWHERRARLWAEGAHIVDFPARAAVFSGVTPAEGIGGEFLDIGTASPRDLEGKTLKGKIVLVRRDVLADYPDVWLTDRLVPLGVAGMIFYSAPRKTGIPTVYFNFKRALKEPTPPSVVISYEDALRISQAPPARVTLVVEADIEWHDSHSVVGELRGAVKPEEIVLFSAHDDTAYSSPGAVDDGGGVAAVMELARAFSKQPRPARTLRFIAWGGHELGLMGSEAYLRKNAASVEKMVALINYDGFGSALGKVAWTAAGDESWVKFLRGVSTGLQMEEPWSVGPSGTDAVNFSALEIPSLQISHRGGSAEAHTPKDTLAVTSAASFDDGLLLAASIGAALANDTNLRFPHRFPPDLLKAVRDYAARWGWGVRPEANAPPRAAIP